MKILDMIALWRRGCSFSTPGHPESCVACTLRLINDIEAQLKAEQYSGCITPKLHETIDALQDNPPTREDIDSLLLEFHRLDAILKQYSAHKDKFFNVFFDNGTKNEQKA